MLNMLFRKLRFEVNRTQTFHDRLSSARSAFLDWRSKRDIAAIASTLNRLSDRRLELIGMQRHCLDDAVVDLISRADEQRAIGREIIALFDGKERTSVVAEPQWITHDPNTRSAA